MSISNKVKLYAYVDESGQDTKGLFFVVSIVVLFQDMATILAILEKIEEISKKRTKKWHKAPYKYRRAYIEGLLLHSKYLRNILFFEIFNNSKKYIELTSYATAKAILKKAKREYTASIFIDGFNKRELWRFEQGLKELRINKRKVRGVRREESNIYIRLAAALCGLIRDSQEKNKWATDALHNLQKKKIVVAS